MARVGPLGAVCPPTQSHFLGDPRVAQYQAFGIPEGVRNPTLAPPRPPPTLIFHMHDEP